MEDSENRKTYGGNKLWRSAATECNLQNSLEENSKRSKVTSRNVNEK